MAAGRLRRAVAAHGARGRRAASDPVLRTEHLYQFENVKVLGLSEVRQRALKSRAPFPYDTEVEGLRVLDRYRFEVRLAEPASRVIHMCASAHLSGAVGREVVEAYGSDLMAHPVGTGPFMLQPWRRASRIVLVRNPRFRRSTRPSRRPTTRPRRLAFDRLYERQRVLPDGPARHALMRDATRTMLDYVRYIAHHHPYATDLMQARVQGHRSHPFSSDWWRYASA